MIEIAGTHGYEAVTVRDLARLARVSTRTCYSCLGGKEECFLRTHELVAKRVLRAVAIADADARDGAERLRLALGAFTAELARDPRAARLLLVEPYAAGPAALQQLRWAIRALEERIAGGFASVPGATELPELVIEVVVAGVERIARARLVAGRERELSPLGDSLAQWALLYRSATAAAALADLDRRFVPRGSATEPSLVPSSGTEREESGARSPEGDCALLLSAVAKLAAADGDRPVTASRIRAMAGLTRRRFDAHFDSAEDCLLAAREAHLRAVLARAEEAEALGRTWAGGLCRAAASICAELSADCPRAGLFFGRATEAAEVRAASIERRRRLLAEIIAHIRKGALPESYPGDLAVEASLQAAWALLGGHAAEGPGAAERAQQAATVAYLVLVPLIGPEAALASIRDEVEAAESGATGRPALETAV